MGIYLTAVCIPDANEYIEINNKLPPTRILQRSTRGQEEMADCSPEVLATSRGPSDFHLAAETQHSPNEFNVATNQ